MTNMYLEERGQIHFSSRVLYYYGLIWFIYVIEFCNLLLVKEQIEGEKLCHSFCLPVQLFLNLISSVVYAANKQYMWTKMLFSAENSIVE